MLDVSPVSRVRLDLWQEVFRMIAAILGKKVGMTRVYNDKGEMVPATVIEAGPCPVLQVKTHAIDGYEAVQLGFEDARAKRTSMAMIGHCARTGATPKRFIREVRLQAASDRQPGQTVNLAEFAEKGVAYVDVVGVTKGKGFQGVMKRWGFGGQSSSHGTERKHRSAGTIASYGSERGGAGGPKKGKPMAGHMGHTTETSRNHKVLRVIVEHNLLVVSGSIPGPNGGYLVVRQAVVPPLSVIKAAKGKK
jgi:large subunit ribosomal protein L3